MNLNRPLEYIIVSIKDSSLQKCVLEELDLQKIVCWEMIPPREQTQVWNFITWCLSKYFNDSLCKHSCLDTIIKDLYKVQANFLATFGMNIYGITESHTIYQMHMKIGNI